MTSKPAITLKYEEPDNGSSQSKPNDAKSFEQLWGTIRIVSAVPDWTPRGRLEDSLALYSNAGTRRLYIYDSTSGSWHYASLT